MSSRSTRSGGGGGGGARGTKRPRTDDDDQLQQFKRDDDDGSQTQQQPQPNNNNNNQPRGRPQLLLNTDELRKRTGKKYCDEAELVPLLLAHGLIRRVRTIAVEVRPLSGESFDIKLDAKAPTVGGRRWGSTRGGADLRAGYQARKVCSAVGAAARWTRRRFFLAKGSARGRAVLS